jgi:hypothetical protein
MDREIRYRVRGLGDPDKAHQVEAMLHAKVGIREVRADAETGRLWLRYDAARVPQPRLRQYLKDAGVSPLEVESDD